VPVKIMLWLRKFCDKSGLRKQHLGCNDGCGLMAVDLHCRILGTALCWNGSITDQELADEVGVSVGLVIPFWLRIWVPAKFVQKLITKEQKQIGLEIAQDRLDCVESDSNSRHGPLRFLTVSQNENAIERDPIWVNRRHYVERDSTAKHE